MTIQSSAQHVSSAVIHAQATGAAGEAAIIARRCTPCHTAVLRNLCIDTCEMGTGAKAAFASQMNVMHDYSKL